MKRCISTNQAQGVPSKQAQSKHKSSIFRGGLLAALRVVLLLQLLAAVVVVVGGWWLVVLLLLLLLLLLYISCFKVYIIKQHLVQFI